MKIVKITKKDGYRIAWMANGLGFIVRPGFKIEVGEELNSDIHFFQSELKKLKTELALILRSGRPAAHTQKYKDWILSLFDKKDIIKVRKIQDMAKEKNYSWQMIQKTRSGELRGEIDPIFVAEKGWCWSKKSPE